MQKEWLQLAHSKGLSIAEKRILVRALGSPPAVLQAAPTALAAALTAAADAVDDPTDPEHSTPKPPKPTRKKRRARRETQALRLKYPDVTADLACLERLGGDFIGFTDGDFPPLLNHIQGAPLGLFVLGERALLRSPQLAMVGSRNPTPAGRRTTQQLATELCAAGLTITSGLAVGIDGCAHRGCLDAAGKTIAVMASGLDIAYPRAHCGLYQEIAEQGLVVTEYSPGTPPRREHFPQRNRIISGLSLGTLVVEAGIHSGSLITARLAGEQGREVFAVPGSIHVAVSRGCHQLLRQGAKLVENCADITDEIGHWFAAPALRAETTAETAAETTAPPSPNGTAARLYNLIDYAPVSTDQLIAQSGLTTDEVSYILMQLELTGWIAATTGGYQRLPQ